MSIWNALRSHQHFQHTHTHTQTSEPGERTRLPLEVTPNLCNSNICNQANVAQSLARTNEAPPALYVSSLSGAEPAAEEQWPAARTNFSASEIGIHISAAKAKLAKLLANHMSFLEILYLPPSAKSTLPNSLQILFLFKPLITPCSQPNSLQILRFSRDPIHLVSFRETQPNSSQIWCFIESCTSCFHAHISTKLLRNLVFFSRDPILASIH